MSITVVANNITSTNRHHTISIRKREYHTQCGTSYGVLLFVSPTKNPSAWDVFILTGICQEPVFCKQAEYQ